MKRKRREHWIISRDFFLLIWICTVRESGNSKCELIVNSSMCDFTLLYTLSHNTFACNHQILMTDPLVARYSSRWKMFTQEFWQQSHNKRILDFTYIQLFMCTKSMIITAFGGQSTNNCGEFQKFHPLEHSVVCVSSSAPMPSYQIRYCTSNYLTLLSYSINSFIIILLYSVNTMRLPISALS